MLVVIIRAINVLQIKSCKGINGSYFHKKFLFPPLFFALIFTIQI